MVDTPKSRYKRDYRKVTIRTTDGATLSGKVNIGIKDRLSDLFTKGESPFVVLSDAGYKDRNERVFIINKNNIVWVEPED